MAGGTEKELKALRRGEVVYQQDEPIPTSYLIKSGLASLALMKNGQAIDLGKAGSGHIIGEERLWGDEFSSCQIVVENEIKLEPINLKQALAPAEASNPFLRLFLRSLIDKQKTWWSLLLKSRAKGDTTPCPIDKIVKLFAVIYHVSSYIGEKKNGGITVVWPTFKKYCQRVFLESPVRLEAAVYILVRAGAAKLEMIPCETDPDAPDELGFVHFTDLERVKKFYEWYRSRLDTASLTPAQADMNCLMILQEIEEWNKTGKVISPIEPKKEEE